MTPAERHLLAALLCRARRYVEFGAGGSTCLAARLVGEAVTSVDSSPEWLARVRAACLDLQLPISPTLVHADIGETGAWGYPADTAGRDRWPDYHARVWSDPEAAQADLYLVDGRFRVACFMQTVLRCRPEARIAIHDFGNRPAYHVVREVAQEIAATGTLSVFLRRPDFDPQRARAILEAHAFLPP
ncbi:hypothetical protein [Roseicella aerolata]|uniref:Uncharacterized protein n=1 Tax=Roseicella aerolata TaxID=2883479 RepID=A0A9X1LBQ9_9PROT|nr:hypothetical protein [Roseicella aerolata]MCB4823450.1 hypothetical protein [Roseicella aerolata]